MTDDPYCRRCRTHPCQCLDQAAAEITRLKAVIAAKDAEILRVVDALEYAHSNGFEWPVDPLPFGSMAHDLFIERGNDPERIAQRAAIAQKGASNV